MQEHRFAQGKDEDCGICMGKMQVARRLRCGHCFHQFCLMQMILNKNTICPMCREDIYQARQPPHQARPVPPPPAAHGPPGRPPGGLPLGLGQRVIGSLMHNVFMPFSAGANRLHVPEADIGRVLEVYPDLPRDQIIHQLVHAGSVEQAIRNIADTL